MASNEYFYLKIVSNFHRNEEIDCFLLENRACGSCVARLRRIANREFLESRFANSVKSVNFRQIRQFLGFPIPGIRESRFRDGTARAHQIANQTGRPASSSFVHTPVNFLVSGEVGNNFCEQMFISGHYIPKNAKQSAKIGL